MPAVGEPHPVLALLSSLARGQGGEEGTQVICLPPLLSAVTIVRVEKEKFLLFSALISNLQQRPKVSAQAAEKGLDGPQVCNWDPRVRSCVPALSA